MREELWREKERSEGLRTPSWRLSDERAGAKNRGGWGVGSSEGSGLPLPLLATVLVLLIVAALFAVYQLAALMRPG